MDVRSRRAYGPYLVAVIATALAGAARVALSALFAVEAPFFPFMLAVLVTARVGGLLPGLVATALGAVLGSYLYVQPSLTTWTERSGVTLAACLFAILGVTASLICGALYRAKRRSEEQQRKRRQAEQALIDADRHKDEFLATLAHELRTPLAPMRYALEVLRHAAAEGDRMGDIHRILERQLDHLGRLVDDLLDVSRIAAGKLELRKERVNLAEVIRSAIDTARPAMETSMHELTVSIRPDSISVEADPIRLAQVFVNLLTNAAKFTEKNGRIWLTAARQGREVRVAVRDTGIGIAAENLPHVFGRYSQVASTMKRSHGGLGIGLALVKIVELHGGRVEAHSEGLGLGSTFTVHLMVVESQTSQASPAFGATGDWLVQPGTAPFKSRTPPPPVRPAR